MVQIIHTFADGTTSNSIYGKKVRVKGNEEIYKLLIQTVQSRLKGGEDIEKVG